MVKSWPVTLMVALDNKLGESPKKQMKYCEEDHEYL